MLTHNCRRLSEGEGVVAVFALYVCLKYSLKFSCQAALLLNRLLWAVVKRLIFAFYVKCDRLSSIGFYTPSIVYGWRPTRRFSNNSYCFFFHSIAVIGFRYYMTHAS